MAAVRGTQHPTDTSLVSSTSNVNTSSYIQDNGCDIGSQGFGYWYTASSALAIRMNFGYISSVEDDIKTGFSVYPNPSTGLITIDNQNNDNYDFVVRNILGQIAYTGISNNMSKSSIDLSGLDSGVYTIEFDSKKSSYTKKLIIE